MRADEIVQYMAVADGDFAIQLVQTHHRINLVEAWGIPPGSRVLEIACGQGDMTAVLAGEVGPEGHVTAVDIASPAYGAPITVGDAMAHLQASPIGNRIEARFGFDLLDPATDFGPDAFDYVVLAHGAWYFANLDQLTRTLDRVRPWAPRLCFAEWDLTPSSFEQVAHLLAVLIQGQIETVKPVSDANIRTPFSRARFERLLADAGWDVVAESAIDASSLQDAEWEIDTCLTWAVPEAETLDLPPRLRDLIQSQADTLRALARNPAYPPRPLPVYALTASRANR